MFETETSTKRIFSFFSLHHAIFVILYNLIVVLLTITESKFMYISSNYHCPLLPVLYLHVWIYIHSLHSGLEVLPTIPCFWTSAQSWISNSIKQKTGSCVLLYRHKQTFGGRSEAEAFGCPGPSAGRWDIPGGWTDALLGLSQRDIRRFHKSGGANWETTLTFLHVNSRFWTEKGKLKSCYAAIAHTLSTQTQHVWTFGHMMPWQTATGRCCFSPAEPNNPDLYQSKTGTKLDPHAEIKAQVWPAQGRGVRHPPEGSIGLQGERWGVQVTVGSRLP